MGERIGSRPMEVPHEPAELPHLEKSPPPPPAASASARPDLVGQDSFQAEQPATGKKRAKRPARIVDVERPQNAAPDAAALTKQAVFLGESKLNLERAAAQASNPAEKARLLSEAASLADKIQTLSGQAAAAQIARAPERPGSSPISAGAEPIAPKENSPQLWRDYASALESRAHTEPNQGRKEDLVARGQAARTRAAALEIDSQAAQEAKNRALIDEQAKTQAQASQKAAKGLVIDAASSKRMELKARRDDLRGELGLASRQAEQIGQKQAEHERIQGASRTLAQEIDKLGQDYSLNSQSINATTQRLGELNSELKANSGFFQALLRLFGGGGRAPKAIKQELETVKQRQGQLLKEQQGLSGELSQKQKAQTALAGQLGSLRQELGQAQIRSPEDVAGLKAEIEKLTEQMGQLNISHSSDDESITQAQSLLNQLEKAAKDAKPHTRQVSRLQDPDTRAQLADRQRSSAQTTGEIARRQADQLENRAKMATGKEQEELLDRANKLRQDAAEREAQADFEAVLSGKTVADPTRNKGAQARWATVAKTAKEQAAELKSQITRLESEKQEQAKVLGQRTKAEQRYYQPQADAIARANIENKIADLRQVVTNLESPDRRIVASEVERQQKSQAG